MAGTPDWNLLPLFVSVADASSISGAARTLRLPKSSVSRGIASLESALGVQLFHRSTRNVALTTAGVAFYERARKMVASLRELGGSLPEQESEPSGVLRLTAPVDLGLTRLAELVSLFALRHPAVQLDVRLSNRFVDLIGEGFDAALRIGGKLADSSLVARKLSEVDFGIYASPTYLARRGMPKTSADTAGHDWVWLPIPRGALNLPPVKRPRLATDDLLFAHGAVREGMGLGLIPNYVARADVTSGLLVRVLPRWSSRGGVLRFMHPPAAQLPRKVAAFRDFLVAYFRDRPLEPRGD